MAETDLIASLKQINATLLQEMEGKQQEVEELRKHLEELVGSDDDNLKDRKIVDLAKKVFDMCFKNLFACLEQGAHGAIKQGKIQSVNSCQWSGHTKEKNWSKRKTSQKAQITRL